MPDVIKRILKRQLREKAVVRDAAKGVQRLPSTEGRAVRSSKTSTGLPIQGQVRKRWNPRKGGLPTLCRT